MTSSAETQGEITFSEFRTHCRRLARDVAVTGEVLRVTHNGRPFIEVRPVAAPQSTLTARAVTSTTSRSDEPA